MPDSEATQKVVDEYKLENARWGYQVAVSLWSSRADELWSQFNAIMTANSIVLAATLAIGGTHSTRVLSIGMPIVGLVLCTLWLALHARGVGYTQYWALTARELEENYLADTVKSLSRGSQFGDGQTVNLLIGGRSRPMRMNLVGRIFRARWSAYFVIVVFAAMYLSILFWR